MHSNQMAAERRAAQFLGQCRQGFENEHHWHRWLRKHQMEISALPYNLKAAVLMAWEQSGPKEISR